MKASSVDEVDVNIDEMNESESIMEAKARSTKSYKKQLLDLLLKRGDNTDYPPNLINKNGDLNREQVTLALVTILCMSALFGTLSKLLCNIIGFAYPLYASVKAIRSEKNDTQNKWLIYWTVLAGFCFTENFAAVITTNIPFYGIFKAMFLLSLYWQDGRGAKTLYHNMVNPAVTSVDDCVKLYHSEKNTNVVIAEKTIETPKI